LGSSTCAAGSWGKKAFYCMKEKLFGGKMTIQGHLNREDTERQKTNDK
jgi:hypothetical protein